MTDTLPVSGLRTPVRNRYFYGKLLDEQHLQLEQDYFNGKRAMLNRLLAGTGVVQGCDVTVSAGGGLTISPGLALDPLGLEIVVAEAVEVDPRQPTDAQGNPSGACLDGPATTTVGLSYAERATEPVPVFANSDDGEPASAPSLVEEGFAVVVTTDESTAGVVLARVQLGAADAPLGTGDVDGSVRQAVASGPEVSRLIAALQRGLSGQVVSYLGGDAQSQDPATVLETPLTISVTDQRGAAVARATVTFAVRGGGGQVSADGKTFAESVDVITGKDGEATAQWLLGDAPGIGSVAAGVPGGTPVVFVALALPTDTKPKPRARARTTGKSRPTGGSA